MHSSFLPGWIEECSFESPGFINKTIYISHIEDDIIICTLNRPEASNAFNSKMAEEIYTFFEEFSIGNKKFI